MIYLPINSHTRPPATIGMLIDTFIWSAAIWFAVGLVAASSSDAQVFAAIIGLDFIVMVYVLTKQQWTTNNPFHDNAMHQQSTNFDTTAHKSVARGIAGCIGHPFKLGKISIFVIEYRSKAARQRYFNHFYFLWCFIITWAYYITGIKYLQPEAAGMAANWGQPYWRIGPRGKCRAWLKAAPRTTRQLAQLCDITPQHAASIVWQLRQRGEVEPCGGARGSHDMRYRLCQTSH